MAGGAAPARVGRPGYEVTAGSVTFHGSGAALLMDRCLTHLIDPTNSVRLTLVRSIGAEQREAAEATGVSTGANPQGDFSTEPQFPYGLRAGELLRVDCATGRALGAVNK